MTFFINFNDEEERLIKDYSVLKGTTASEFIRHTVMEKIEDELDLEVYEKAIEEHRNNDESITHKEMKKELGL